MAQPINIDPTRQQPLYGGSTPSESSIKRRRRLSEALLSGATDASPVGHWTQALARGLNGYLAGRENRIADQEEGQRSQALAEALGGGKSPEELMALSAQYGAPELMQAAEFRYGQGRDAVKDNQWQQGFSADQAYRGQQQNNWQQGFNADQEYRNRPPEPKRYEVGGNLVDETGNVVYQGTPKPPKLTEGEIKGEAIQAGALPAIAALTEGGNQANPVPILDELASVQNSIGRAGENWGGAAIMSPRAQVAMDSLKSLTQQYIYALSGAQAPEQEVQRKMSTVIPSALDSPERVAQKRAEVMGMIETLKVRAQRTEGGTATGAKQFGSPSLGAPQPGSVMDGYQFQGGDPSNPQSWVKVQ